MGGYRDEIGGFVVGDEFKPLINIEIVGATHFDYMRADNPSSTLLDAAAQFKYLTLDKPWNESVSAFAADIIAHASSYDELVTYLQRADVQAKHQATIGDEGDRWVVYLPGWELRNAQ